MPEAHPALSALLPTHSSRSNPGGQASPGPTETALQGSLMAVAEYAGKDGNAAESPRTNPHASQKQN